MGDRHSSRVNVPFISFQNGFELSDEHKEQLSAFQASCIDETDVDQSKQRKLFLGFFIEHES